MFWERIEDENIVMQGGTSEGTQIKYRKGKYWYKKDNRGSEGLAEYLIFSLLTFSDLGPSEYVVYERGFINGAPGCRSENFLKDGEELVTFYRLYRNEYGTDLSSALDAMETMERQWKSGLHMPFFYFAELWAGHDGLSQESFHVGYADSE